MKICVIGAGAWGTALAASASAPRGDAPAHVVTLWARDAALVAALKAGRFGGGYPTVSWYALLAGMGVFPDPQDLKPPTEPPKDEDAGKAKRRGGVDDYLADSTREMWVQLGVMLLGVVATVAVAR